MAQAVADEDARNTWRGHQVIPGLEIRHGSISNGAKGFGLRLPAREPSAVPADAAAGHPVVVYTLDDLYALGGEFYRWEFAAAIAGRVMGVQPFNQPNVQQVKDLTDAELARFQESGDSPNNMPFDSLAMLLNSAKPNDYLAILAYIEETNESNRMFESLRHKVIERTGIATTLGYGPRYLHSTGQLHKAGPVSGLFLEVTTDDSNDVDLPGEPYSLKVLADAQSAGDISALRAANRRFARVVLESVSDLHSLEQELE